MLAALWWLVGLCGHREGGQPDPRLETCSACQVESRRILCRSWSPGDLSTQWLLHSPQQHAELGCVPGHVQEALGSQRGSKFLCTH